MLSATRAARSFDMMTVKTQSETQKGYTSYVYPLSIFRFTTGRNSTEELHISSITKSCLSIWRTQQRH